MQLQSLTNIANYLAKIFPASEYVITPVLELKYVEVKHCADDQAVATFTDKQLKQINGFYSYSINTGGIYTAATLCVRYANASAQEFCDLDVECDEIFNASLGYLSNSIPAPEDLRPW